MQIYYTLLECYLKAGKRLFVSCIWTGSQRLFCSATLGLSSFDISMTQPQLSKIAGTKQKHLDNRGYSVLINVCIYACKDWGKLFESLKGLDNRGCTVLQYLVGDIATCNISTIDCMISLSYMYVAFGSRKELGNWRSRRLTEPNRHRLVSGLSSCR